VQRKLRVVALVAALALVLAGCGDDDDDNGASAATTVVTEQPERIVSLSPTATEILFAIDAGERVVAVDDQSNYPAEAPKTQLSGFQPNLEAIAAYNPDLVVLSSDTKEIVDGLKAVGAEVIVQDAAKVLDDTYLQIKALGKATGHSDEADGLVETMEQEISALATSIPDAAKGKTYYHELDPTYFTVTSKTFIGEVYGLFGLKNIADAADSEGGGYPQLSVEYIVQQSPDFVFLADTKCCNQNAQSVAGRPGWGSITAVKDGHVIALDDDIASRWGPRVVDFIKVVADPLKSS
jgi:iron complex transport system substrate-binding protein